MWLRAWPWPALWAWLAAWLVREGALAAWGVSAWLAWGLGCLPVLLVARIQGTVWRRIIVVLGWPLMAWAAGWWTSGPSDTVVELTQGPWRGVFWLLAAGLIWLAYPSSTWGDAPWFPTRLRALQDLPPLPGLPVKARILDVGSGLGHGLMALRARFPQARLSGVERSALLVWLSRLNLRRTQSAGGPAVQILRGDMWAQRWGEFDAVYLFQRPETMRRAWQKACADMRPGSWFITLAFEVPGETADITHAGAGQRPVWAYRIPPA